MTNRIVPGTDMTSRIHEQTFEIELGEAYLSQLPWR